jgi:hypothetical protein
MRTAMTVFGTFLGAVIVLTFMTGGSFLLGTDPTGPRFSLGFRGPQNR